MIPIQVVSFSPKKLQILYVIVLEGKLKRNRRRIVKVGVTHNLTKRLPIILSKECSNLIEVYVALLDRSTAYDMEAEIKQQFHSDLLKDTYHTTECFNITSLEKMIQDSNVTALSNKFSISSDVK